MPQVERLVALTETMPNLAPTLETVEVERRRGYVMPEGYERRTVLGKRLRAEVVEHYQGD